MDAADHLQLEREPANQQRPAWRNAISWRWLRVALAIALLLFLLRWIDVNALANALIQADLRFVLLVMLFALLDRFLMSYKWGMLVRARGLHLSVLEAFKIYLVSGFVGAFLPTGVGGDIFRAVHTTVNGRRGDAVTASIVLERAIGLVAVSIVALLGLTVLLGVYGATQFRTLYYVLWLVLLALITSLLLSIHPISYRLISRLTTGLQRLKIVRLYLSFHNAYTELGQHRKVLLVFLLMSICEQVILCLMNHMAARALGVSISFLFFLAVIPLSNFTMLLPITLGGIGVDESAYIFLFGFTGLSPTEAVSIMLLMRLIGWVMLLPGGLITLYDSIKLRRLRP